MSELDGLARSGAAGFAAQVPEAGNAGETL
jgi:hypothetical protein